MESNIISSEHVSRQLSSGLSVSKYCEENGIAANTFYNWKNKAKKKSGFVRISPATEKIKLELSNGTQICVEADSLKIVLETLNAL